MKKKQYSLFIAFTIIIVPVNIYAKNIHSRYRRRTDNEFESNYIHDGPESSSIGYNSFVLNADDAYTPSPSPSPSPRESLTTYTTYNERLSPSPNYHHHVVSTNFKHQSPIKSMERKFTGKQSQFKDEKYNPNNEQEYGYILTAGGKENIYEEDIANAYKPHEFEPPYPRKFETEKISEPKTPVFMTGKRVTNYEKSFNKYRYSYSNRGAEGSLKPEMKVLSKSEFRKDSPKARSFSSELQNYPQYQNQNQNQNQKYGDDFGMKTATWKQLGPNVEISPSADNPTYARPPEVKPKKMYKKRKPSSSKGMRTGYMGNMGNMGINTPQHALYVANNIPNLKPINGVFDHSNVLKQSDKFEITDAMTMELEKENAKKGENKIRIKQESPKDQPYNFESPEYQHFQFFNPPVSQLYNINPYQINKFNYPVPGAGLSKGFVRNIEVETNSSGGKKTIPALIIPLTPEQVNNPNFNADALTAAYMNNLNVINAKPKPAPFPYDIVGGKYPQNDLGNSLSYQNYQFQNFYPYQYRNNQNFEENYNPFINFANPGILPRYSLNVNPSPTPINEETKPTPDTTYSTQPLYQSEEEQSNLPFSIVIPNKKSNTPAPSEIARTDFKASEEYFEEPHEESKYLSPAESNFLSTVTNVKENQNVSQPFNNSDHRST